MAPLTPAQRASYGLPLSDVLLAHEYDAVLALRSLVDPAADYALWEHLTARMLLGAVTAHRAPYDVLTEAGKRVEVKFSREFVSGGRLVMRWVGMRRDAADVTALWGLDAVDTVWLWVAPSVLLAGSALVTSPRARVHAGERSPLAPWAVPPDQIIPAFGRALSYDRHTHPNRKRSTT